MNLKNNEPSFHTTLMRKRILTFLCALWPGGGYMYFGMMKKGALMMSLFTATAGLTLTVGWKFLGFLLPVIWCYCFFDTFHCSRLSDAQRKAEDTWFFRKTVRMLREDPLNSLKERKNVVGTILLLFALYTVVYGVLLPFFRWGEEFFWVRLTLSVIPTAVVAVLLFMLGKHLLQKDAEERARAKQENNAETAEMTESKKESSFEAAGTEQETAAEDTAPENEDVVEQGAPVFLQERDESLIAEAALAALEEDEKAQ